MGNGLLVGFAHHGSRLRAWVAILTTIKTRRSRKTPHALKLVFAVTGCQPGGRRGGGRLRAPKVKTGTLVKPSMTDTPGV
eukprot:128746-Prymnesium_polylepis.3